MVIQKKIGSRLIIFGIGFLLFVNVFPQEINIQKTSDQILFERVEKYLNDICDFDRTFLNLIAAKISQPDNIYVPLDKKVPVRLMINENLALFFLGTGIEDFEIYITSGYLLILENEAELAGKIAHELGHLSSLSDRKNPANTDEEYLRSEIVADRAAIFVLKETGCNPRLVPDVLARILAKYSDKLTRHKEILVHRYLAAKKLADEICSSESNNHTKYKEYLYFSEIEFKSIKTIAKYLQDKKSGK